MAVKRHTKDDLACWDSLSDIVVDRFRGIEWSTNWVAYRREEVCLVGRFVAPAPSVIIRHKKPEIDVLIHLSKM